MFLNRRWVTLLSAVFVLTTFLYLSQSPPPVLQDLASKLPDVPLPKIDLSDLPSLPIPSFLKKEPALYKLQYEARDDHPISKLMENADKQFLEYQESSRTFKETVSKYRRKYGRHPPPGFAEWYKFAKQVVVHNVDDFEQIMDDLKPFWSLSPIILRTISSHLGSVNGSTIDTIHIRNGSSVPTGRETRKTAGFLSMIEKFVSKLPDMDIPINSMDQPRVLVPFEELQGALAEARKNQVQHPETTNTFSQNQDGLAKLGADSTRNDMLDVLTRPTWVDIAGKNFMDYAKKACSPISYANDENGEGRHAMLSWKKTFSGMIQASNFSMDLCTIGPEIASLHGFLFASSTMSITESLVPVFSESKTSVNNDILFPATMYYKEAFNARYDVKQDSKWDQKVDKVFWRGNTNSGKQTAENWPLMHRARLVTMLNGTHMKDGEPKILGKSSLTKNEYDMAILHPESFLENHTDVAFDESWNCDPGCGFYNDQLMIVPQSPPVEQYKNKLILDVDSEGFSGRWGTLLRSQSLVLKSTIFREWHHSRLFAWRHYVPIDNTFDELLSILTYFFGVGKPEHPPLIGSPFVPKHDFEAKRIAYLGREWAGKVLRKEDIEVYIYRLLLEYGRLMDENRDRIGYSGDGAEIDDALGHPG